MIKLYKAIDDLYFDEYYQMKCLKNNIFHSGFSTVPSKEKMHSIFLDKLGSTTYELFFLLKDDQVKAYGQIKHIKNNSHELAFASLYPGHGFGNRVLKEIKEYCLSKNEKNIFMYISIINVISSLIAEKNGFIRTSKFDLRYNATIKQDIRFEEWILRK